MARSSARFRVEPLEERVLAGVLFQPTGDEQLFLELINRARANPAAYGDSIGIDLSDVAASEPLALNLQLVTSARRHSQDMHDRDFFDHVNPDGDDPGNRIDAVGYNWTGWAESIAAGYHTPANALAALIIDDGVPDLGHRKHLLEIGPDYSMRPEVGVGIFNGPLHFQDYYTIDSARDFDPAQPHDPFLTGVVYNDVDLNDFYSPGEGLAGITIDASGPVHATTTTFASGGYSLRLPAGTYDVTVSGSALGPAQTVSVTIGAHNIKEDFHPTAPLDQLAVWSGDWKLDTNKNNVWDDAAGGDQHVAQFGNPARDVPAAIDWDGDGKDELAYLRFGKALFIDTNHNGVWDGRSIDTKVGGLSQPCQPLGPLCDQLVVGDWNGDGRDDFGVLHKTTGVFQLDSNGNRFWDDGDAQFPFIPLRANDVAIAGDWNGDGVTDVGIYRLTAAGKATFLIDSNGNHQWDAGDARVRFGKGFTTADRPAPGNYDADSRTELAILSNGTFKIAYDNNGAALTARAFTPGLYAVPGQWA